MGNKRTLEKAINSNTISLRTFASSYYDVRDTIIAEMTHDDFSTYASDNHILVQRVPFAIITEEALRRGFILVVTDKYNQKVPFLHPEHVKLNDYTSMLELRLQTKYKCDIEINRISYHLIGVSIDEISDSIIKENLIMMGILVYNLDVNSFKQHKKIMTYEDYKYLEKEIEQYEKDQIEMIAQLIEEEYRDTDLLGSETWLKSCDCEKVVPVKKMKKKRGKS